MKIIGLLIVKNEADILKESLDHMAKWMDGVVAIDNGSTDGTWDILTTHPIIKACSRDILPFDEARLVPKLIQIAEEENADWYVDNDADEFFPLETRKFLEICDQNKLIVTVDICSEINGRIYDEKKLWRRCYRNKPELFDFSFLGKLHKGKIPLPKFPAFYTDLKVIHKSIRSYDQGIRKYQNYLELDTEKTQSYEHIRQLAECLNTGDFTGVQWVN